MRPLIMAGWWLATCFPLSALANSAAPVASERMLREECSEFSQAGMHDCLATKAAESRVALRQAEQYAAGAIARWDEDRKFVTAATARLATSSKDFAKYRQSQCAFAYSLGGGAIGSALEMRRFACEAELNNRRAEQLRSGVVHLLAE